jgi:hypothetical protein
VSNNSIEIPMPLIQVVAEEHWKSARSPYGWHLGINEFSVTIQIGDVVLMARTSDDGDDDTEDMTLEKLREQTVEEFATRLKEVLGL